MIPENLENLQIYFYYINIVINIKKYVYILKDTLIYQISNIKIQ